MNAIEVDVAGEESVIALYVGMDVINRLESDKKKELKKWLRMRNLPYYWATRKYLEYEPGLYVFHENRDLKLPYCSEVGIIKLQPSSYPIKFLLKALIDSNLQKMLGDKVERLGEDMQGNIVYKLKDPLFSWPSSGVIVYEFYKKISFRVEHIRHIVGYKPTGEPMYLDKLYLLPTIRLQVSTNASLEEIAKHIGDRNLLSLLLYKRVSAEVGTRRDVGLLVDINIKSNLAIVQLAEGEVELPLDNVYLQTNPTWYGEFLREIGLRCGSTYDKLIDMLGLMTYRFEPVPDKYRKRRKIRDAPARYLKDLEVAVKEIIAKVFPISFQRVEYRLSKGFVQIEGEE